MSASTTPNAADPLAQVPDGIMVQARDVHKFFGDPGTVPICLGIT